VKSKSTGTPAPPPIVRINCASRIVESPANGDETGRDVVLNVIWWIAAGLTAAATAYLLLAIAAVAAFRGRGGPGWPTPPRVTLLKPLYGLEDYLEEAIVSALEQRVDGPIRYVFGVHSADDPALALAKRIAARFPEAETVFVVDGRKHGISPKVSNLVNMAEAAGLSEVVVLSDSDTVLEPGELQAAIDALSAPGVGVCSALYRARPGLPRDRVRSFGAWFIDYWFLPMAALHARLAPLAVTYAPLVAIREDVLAKIGGLKALADEFADDNAMGRLVREAGYAVTFVPKVTETLANDPSYAELFTHELRWSRTVRGIDPLGFFASVVTHPGPLPLLLLLRPSWWTAAAVLAPVLLRWLLSRLVVGRMGRAPGMVVPDPVSLWARDLFTFSVWAAACFVRTVDWRGQTIALSGPQEGPIRKAAP
jgi:ceramide glucosyltransferase